jgi:hypothetical protein
MRRKDLLQVVVLDCGKEGGETRVSCELDLATSG